MTKSKSLYITNTFDLPQPFYMFNLLTREADYHLELHSHDRFHVNLITDGAVDVITPKGTLTIQAGEIFVMPPYVEHELWSKDGYSQLGMDVSNINDENGLVKKLHDICSGNAIRTRVPDTGATKYITQNALIDLSPFVKLRCINHMTELLILLLENTNEECRHNNFRYDFINTVTQFNMRRVNLDELCEIMHFSKTHLERLVKQEFGCSVIEYTEKLRFMKVCELLVTTDKNLATIAEESGFYDSSHMNVFFKKHSGITPAKYRRERL